MTTITLDHIIGEQQRLAAMIEAFKHINGKVEILVLSETAIELAPGERYAGLVLAADGRPSHHLVLLPGVAKRVNWDAAKAWASNAGGELPTRQEQALLYANLKAEFEPAWYWSSEAHGSDGSYAWGQYFDVGAQYDNPKSYEGQARAVRRFID